MELYYQNETLFIDMLESIDDNNMNLMKKRLFTIIDDYGIDHIVVKTSASQKAEKEHLKQLEREYKSKYSGNLIIK